MIDALKNRLKSMRVVQPMLPLWRVIRERWRKARAEQSDLPHSVSIELTNEKTPTVSSGVLLFVGLEVRFEL